MLSQTFTAQFTIVNTLKTADSTGLVIGDHAYLTASKGVDRNGDGFFRLTESKANQKGYMYVQKTFPTTMGVIVDFEYKSWRSTIDNYDGADGFTVFLFDGLITKNEFSLGGYGGSLGYATFSNPANTKGLSGGYIGLGFDAYGNYSRSAENRNGGTTGEVPNAVVLRGPTTEIYADSNYYLIGAELGNRSGGNSAIRKRDEIDYNTVDGFRPSDDKFYRRVQVTINKVGKNYEVTVQWRKEAQSAFLEILRYTIDGVKFPLPENLRIGFAGSTGGGFNAQEIRNILITTPGNLRVDSRSNTAFVCNDKINEIVYSIEVTNDTATPLSQIDFEAKIVNELQELVPENQFRITGVETEGFVTTSLTQKPNSNIISGKVALGADTFGIVKVKGEYYKKALNSNAKLSAVSKIGSVEITDLDETNNTALTDVYITRCGVMSNPAIPAYGN